MVSECCGAPVFGEHYNIDLRNENYESSVWGMCSNCKEHSAFHDEENEIHYNDPGDENDTTK